MDRSSNAPPFSSSTLLVDRRPMHHGRMHHRLMHPTGWLAQAVYRGRP